MTIDSDSTSAIARAGHTGAGPGQEVACNIREMVCRLRGRTVNLVWVKGQLHCPSARLRAAREKAWEGKDPGGARVLLANLR
jgi:hypothetical protein